MKASILEVTATIDCINLELFFQVTAPRQNVIRLF